MISTGLFVNYRQSKHVRKQLRQSGRSLLEQFAYNVELALRQRDDMIMVDSTRAAYQPEAGVNEAFVLDAAGIIKTHNNSDKIGRKFNPDQHELLLTKNLQITGRGQYVVGLSLDPGWIGEALYQLRRTIFEITLIMVAVGLVAAGILASLMTEPIERLTGSVETIAEGNYGYQLDMSRGDEIGALASSINEMSQKILRDRQELIEKQKMENELEVGREIQSTFLPDSLPELEGYSLDVVYRASRQVGGDLYDFVELDSDRVAVFIADASGKGVPGALLMANTIATVRAIFSAQAVSMEDEEDLKDALVLLNRICRENFQEQSFVTLFAGVLDFKRDRFDFARCGHNPLLRYSGQDRKVEVYNPGGVSIGVVPGKMFEQQLEVDTLNTRTGDVLYQYSDGITEVKDKSGELLGVEGVSEFIEGHEDGPPPANELLNVIAECCHDENYSYEDDVVILTMHRE